MSRDVVCIEVQHHHGSVPEWEAALSRHVGQVPPGFSDSEVKRCTPATTEVFRARLEYGALGESVLFKTSASPNQFSRRLRYADASVPSPILLFIQVSGSHRFQQSGKTVVLRPGDWCLLDTLHRFDCWTMNERAEILGLTLGRPLEAEQDDLLHRGAANRLDGKLGTSRGPPRHADRVVRSNGQCPTLERPWVMQFHHHHGLGCPARAVGQPLAARLPRYPGLASQSLR